MDSLEKMQILLIEDNDLDAVLVRRLSQKSNSPPVELTHAHSIREGLAYLQSFKPGLILLDMSLPDSSGLDGLKKILEASREAPVVVLTGLADEAVAAKAKTDGALDYLAKDQLVTQSSVFYSLLQRIQTGESKSSSVGSSSASEKGGFQQGPALNPEIIKELHALDTPGRTSIVEELGKMMLNTYPGKISEMRTLTQNGKIKEAQKIAHQLKSSAGNLGAQTLSRLCGSFEVLKEPYDSQQISSLLEKITSEFERVRLELQAEMKMAD